MPRGIILMHIIDDWKPCLQTVISIPNHKHLAKENPQVIITVEFLFKLCICLNPTITPRCHNIRDNIQSLAFIVLKCNTENLVPFYVTTCNKVGSQIHDVVLKIWMHNKQRNHPTKENIELGLLPRLKPKLVQLVEDINTLFLQDAMNCNLHFLL